MEEEIPRKKRKYTKRKGKRGRPPKESFDKKAVAQEILNARLKLVDGTLYVSAFDCLNILTKLKVI